MVLNPSFLLIGSDAKPSIGGGNAKDVEDNAVRMSLREEVSMRRRRCHWPSLPASVRDHDHTGLPSGTWCTPMLTALVNKDLVNKSAALPDHNFGRRDFSKEGGCVWLCCAGDGCVCSR